VIDEGTNKQNVEKVWVIKCVNCAMDRNENVTLLLLDYEILCISLAHSNLISEGPSVRVNKCVCVCVCGTKNLVKLAKFLQLFLGNQILNTHFQLKFQPNIKIVISSTR
jgi:hypothetical protein